MRHSILTVGLLAIGVQASLAQIKLDGKTTVVFAAPDKGRQVLTTRDDFVTRMSPFDRAARLKTNTEVTEKDYLEALDSVDATRDAEAAAPEDSSG